MGISVKEISDRVTKLLRLAGNPDGPWLQVAQNVLSGTLTVMRVLYGSNAPQVDSLLERWKKLMDAPTNLEYNASNVVTMLKGVLQNIQAEIESGFVGDLHLAITGDVLTDLIKLAREVLDEKEEGAKNVAAVLSAAAYEDTIRRLAKNKGLTIDGEKLADVIIALKAGGILKGPQVGIAQSYLNFRNKALHADWKDIDRSAVRSVLAFVEELLLKHFA